MSAPETTAIDLVAKTASLTPQDLHTILDKVIMPGKSIEAKKAFLAVCAKYGLNPVTREIHPMETRNGGIQAVVGVDGWLRLCNNHPDMDGMVFEDHLNDKGKLTAVTCKIYRKNRTHPVMVTEYMEECFRNSDPWKKWPSRMLRHKALIQCARYAFSFSEIIDPDEAERFKEGGAVYIEQGRIEDAKIIEAEISPKVMPFTTPSTKKVEAYLEPFKEPAKEPKEKESKPVTEEEKNGPITRSFLFDKIIKCKERLNFTDEDMKTIIKDMFGYDTARSCNNEELMSLLLKLEDAESVIE